jgi:hypothetical protein
MSFRNGYTGGRAFTAGRNTAHAPVVNVNLGNGLVLDPAGVGRAVVAAIGAYEKVSGTRWRYL